MILLLQKAWDTLSANGMISGGIVLMAITAVAATIKGAPKKLWEWGRNHLLDTLEVDHTDCSFNWLRAWLADKAKSRYLMAGVAPSQPGEQLPYVSGNEPPTKKPRFYLCPRGVCTIKHRGRRIIAWVTKKEAQGTNCYREKISLQAFWCGREFWKQLLADVHSFAVGKDGPSVEVWVPDGCNWRMLDRKASRPAESLILPDGVREAVIDDAKRFMFEKDWYADRGIPWRRGYLFTGPPGSGKSSLAHVLASILQTNINVASVSSFSSDGSLVECISRVPKGHILLLEDIDASFENRTAIGHGPSFSALLNVLDGVAAQDGRILVMTSNHPEKLDAALTRAGRADVQVFIGNADRKQMAAMFNRFYGKSGMAEIFASSLPSGTISMARLQEFFLQRRDDQSSAMRDVLELAPTSAMKLEAVA